MILSLISLAGPLAFLLGGGQISATAQEEVPYGVAPEPWPLQLGNHRARVQVDDDTAAVRVHIPWRRRDTDPQDKAVLVHTAAGEPVANVACIALSAQAGDIAFEPIAGRGEYLVYYMPFTVSGWAADYRVHYTTPQATADPGWLERNGLTPQQLHDGRWQGLPAARVVELQARNDFHRFDPMEVVASDAEVAALVTAHPEPYLLFPEDRRFPIRMTDHLPLRWIKSGPADQFRGTAQPGEFYPFQVGVYAAGQDLQDMSVEVAPLRSASGLIPVEAWHCFNFAGTDWLGRPIRKRVSVPRGQVQALWFGVQVPLEAPLGTYEGMLFLRPANAPERTVRVSLEVSGDPLPDRGENDLWRLSRLKWLDSTIGLDEEVTAPYTPLEVEGSTVRCLGRSVRFSANGLPESIRSGERELLAAPMSLVVECAQGPLEWTGASATITHTAPGLVAWESTSENPSASLECVARMEADGYLNFTLTVRANADLACEDIRLEIPLWREVARYMVGLGRKGGLRPAEWSWKWDAGRANNMVWLGDFNAGLQCKLKGPNDTWDIYNLVEGVPASWGNGGLGGMSVSEQNGEAVLVRAFTGGRTLRAGEPLQLRFGLLITPVKPLDPAHWNQRYYHLGPNSIQEVLATEANIINIHHGNDLNPHINYPFLRTEALRSYVQAAHEQGVKVKLYYTVRELSSYLPELWPLRSLGTEVFVDGGGGGSTWLREHLITHYAPAWHHIFPDGEVDGAIVTTGLSRWHNYYLEGLRWLIQNVGIDGLYLDGIGYDREVMKRVRKVMDRTRPGCLIDFHSGNEFPFADLRVSPINKYMEHFPYIDSLWFGEGYDYNESPDYWLVEISGIPFGLYGEMLQDNGNPWRGMIYGMTARYYSGADPKHIWRLWDEFGIQHARMMGYWDPACPVRTDNPQVLATAYVRQGKTLVAVASWAPETVPVRLVVDWNALGLDPQRASLYAPPIQGFQPARLLQPADVFTVTPGRGWLFIVDETPREVPVQPDPYRELKLLLEDRFDRTELGEPWQTAVSPHPGNALVLSEGALQITAAANTCAFAERPLPAGAALVECRVFSGTDGGVSWGTGLGLAWPDRYLRVNISAFGNFQVCGTGVGEAFNGFKTPGRWYYLRIRLENAQIVCEASEDAELWDTIRILPRDQFPGDPVAVRLGKTSPSGECVDYVTPAEMGTSAVDDLRVWGPA